MVLYWNRHLWDSSCSCGLLQNVRRIEVKKKYRSFIPFRGIDYGRNHGEFNVPYSRSKKNPMAWQGLSCKLVFINSRKFLFIRVSKKGYLFAFIYKSQFIYGLLVAGLDVTIAIDPYFWSPFGLNFLEKYQPFASCQYCSSSSSGVSFKVLPRLATSASIY